MMVIVAKDAVKSAQPATLAIVAILSTSITAVSVGVVAGIDADSNITDHNCCQQSVQYWSRSNQWLAVKVSVITFCKVSGVVQGGGTVPHRAAELGKLTLSCVVGRNRFDWRGIKKAGAVVTAGKG